MIVHPSSDAHRAQKIDAKTEMRLFPFAGSTYNFADKGASNSTEDPMEHYGDSVSVMEDGNDFYRALFRLEQAAAKRFNLPYPMETFVLSGHEAVILAGGVSNDALGMLPVARTLIASGDPGSFWMVAHLLKRIEDREEMRQVLSLCTAYGPGEWLVLLGETDSLKVAHDPRTGGRTISPLVDGILPEFGDAEMRAFLDTLPDEAMWRLPGQVSEAFALWGFVRSADRVLLCPPEGLGSREHWGVFHMLPGDQDEKCIGVRTVHGFLAPEKCDFTGVSFDDKHCQEVLAMSRLLGVPALSHKGTPLNNPVFARWVAANPGIVQTYISHSRGYFHRNPDAMMVETLSEMQAHPTLPSRWLGPYLQATRLKTSDEECVKKSSVCLGALFGSAAMTPKQRSGLIASIYETTTALGKLGESTLMSGPPVPHIYRWVDIDGPAGLAPYFRASARAARLAGWLGHLGIGIRIPEELQSEQPKVLRWRLTEKNSEVCKMLDYLNTWMAGEG